MSNKYRHLALFFSSCQLLKNGVKNIILCFGAIFSLCCNSNDIFGSLCSPECAQSNGIKIYRVSHLSFLTFDVSTQRCHISRSPRRKLTTLLTANISETVFQEPKSAQSTNIKIYRVFYSNFATFGMFKHSPDD